MTKKIALTMCVLWAAGGCATHNQTRLGGGQVEAVTTTANMASIDAEGNLDAAYHGPGAVTNTDSGGIYNIMQGTPGVLGGNLQDVGSTFVINPGNTEMEGLKWEYDPESKKMSLAIDKLTVDVSEPMKQLVAALQAIMPFFADMTKAEALARIEQMRIAGDIAESMAPLLVQMINLFLQ